MTTLTAKRVYLKKDRERSNRITDQLYPGQWRCHYIAVDPTGQEYVWVTGSTNYRSARILLVDWRTSIAQKRTYSVDLTYGNYGNYWTKIT